eukprot:TRINITY_DN13247_c0_g1_i2.p1 TRINITY_DN13247_c0_g1~~TRINITY_DN13247_c0_g1_i2.p1  ORF type:complete len:192 (-),score=39.13 TRINITY_DN13247_c0_g1_i2:335-874(-)
MAEAVCCDTPGPQVSVSEEQDMESSTHSLPVVTNVERSTHLLIDYSIYRSKKRNSSFSEYFEGDLSQNLLSRKHFLRRDSELPTATVNAIVSRIKEEDSTGLLLKIENRQKISQTQLPFNWFFSRSCEGHIGERKEPMEPIEIGDAKEPKAGPLTMIVAAHFSATSDVRGCNIIMPQSQ